MSGIGVYQPFFAIGVARTSGFAAALLNSISPLLALLIVAALGYERIPRLAVAGTAVAWCGVVGFLVAAHGSVDLGGLSGNLLCLVSATFWAVYSVTSSRLSTRIPHATALATTFAFGTPVLLAYCAPAMLRQDYGHVSVLTWVILVLSAVFPLYVSFRLWAHALAVLGVAATTRVGRPRSRRRGRLVGPLDGRALLRREGRLRPPSSSGVSRSPGWRDPENRSRASADGGAGAATFAAGRATARASGSGTARPGARAARDRRSGATGPRPRARDRRPRLAIRAAHRPPTRSTGPRSAPVASAARARRPEPAVSRLSAARPRRRRPRGPPRGPRRTAGGRPASASAAGPRRSRGSRARRGPGSGSCCTGGRPGPIPAPTRMTCVLTGRNWWTGRFRRRNAATSFSAREVDTPSARTRSFLVNETTGSSRTSRKLR